MLDSAAIQATSTAAATDHLLDTALDQIYREVLRSFDVLIVREHDFAARRNTLAAVRADDWTFRTLPMYDPAYNRLEPHNAFWLQLKGRRGQGLLATLSMRVWTADDVADLLASNRILEDGSAPARCGSIITWKGAAGPSPLRGNLGWLGGAWVDPSLRRRRLPALMLAYAQAVLLRNYRVDFSFGLLEHEKRRLLETSYRFAGVEEGAELLWQGRQTIPLLLCWNSAADMLGIVEETVAAAGDAAAGEGSR